MEMSDFLEGVGKEGNHWMDYHVVMDKIRTYEKKYGIKVWLIVQENASE
ncbi:MAG: hypothetical protein IH842_01760 [Thaumarchaeota archaeon]|nr:hypothetical protein [Nitrososphaerota archaeon]